MSREKVIFELKSAHSGLTSRVVFWSDYGVVMPNLATTNGSFLDTAQLVYGWVGCKLYSVENLALPSLDFSSEKALRDGMRSAYIEWMKSPDV